MLPLGLRVQEKLERLIDKHMRSVGVYRTIALRKDPLTDMVLRCLEGLSVVYIFSRALGAVRSSERRFRGEFRPPLLGNLY
jgi:hypothetical protein